MNYKKILSSYLIRQFLISFFTVSFIIMSIILLFDVIELLRRTASKKYIGFFTVFKMAICKQPQLLNMILPFIFMIATMMTFYKLSKSSELVIIRAAGVSIWGFLPPVLLTSIVIGIINITMINPVGSFMFEQYQKMEEQNKLRVSSSLAFTKSGLWLKEINENGNHIVIRAKTARQDQYTLNLRDVTILELTDRNKPVKTIEAYKGQLIKDFINLTDVKIMTPGKKIIFFDEYKHPTNLTIGRIQENFADPNTLSFWQLPGYINFFESAGFSAVKHKMYFLTLLFSPFMLMSMVLVAAVFSMQPNNRKGGVLKLVVGGVTSGFIVYFFTNIINAYGTNGTIPIYLAAIGPSMVASLISISLLLHLEDG